MTKRPSFLQRLAARFRLPWGRKAESSERALMQEIVQVCARAARGDNEARILLAYRDSELGAVGRSINHLLDMSDAFVREAAAAMSHCSQDQFHRPILLRGMHGTYRQSALVINQAGRTMRTSSQQLTRVAALASETASNARASARSSSNPSTGTFRRCPAWPSSRAACA